MKKLLLKQIKKIYLYYVLIIGLAMILIGSSYAIFMVQSVKEGALSVATLPNALNITTNYAGINTTGISVPGNNTIVVNYNIENITAFNLSYRLVYTGGSNINVKGLNNVSDALTGTINKYTGSDNDRSITLVIKNSSPTAINVIVGIDVIDVGGAYNDLPTGSQIVSGMSDIDYVYTGSYQKIIIPKTGYYEISTWGASGGMGLTNGVATHAGGKGGYANGKVLLTKDEEYYIYIGGAGMNALGSATSGEANASNVTGANGGYNGGAKGGDDNNPAAYGNEPGGGGGGATDIRYFVDGTPSSNELVSDSSLGLNSRIMVAGGGGGSAYGGTGGAGGGLGSVAGSNSNVALTTQNMGNKFGIGQAGSPFNSGTGGGGGGYYGGLTGTESAIGGEGGSSFISGYAGANAIYKFNQTTGLINDSDIREHANTIRHYSGKYFIDGKTIAGNNSGNGKANIKYFGATAPEHKNTLLDGVRYIKDCLKGSSSSTYNLWSELEVVKNGVNIAKNLAPTGYDETGTVVNAYSNYPYASYTDGNTHYTPIAGTHLTTATLHCLVVDLGSEQNLDELAVWHYWIDGRVFDNNNTYVAGSDGVYRTLINSSDIVTKSAETPDGKRINAYTNLYKYTGAYQKYTVPKTGTYKIEAWGANGGQGMCNGELLYAEGSGGYTSGTITLTAGTNYYIYVGSRSIQVSDNATGTDGGYNGGGKGGNDANYSSSGSNEPSGGGGGASDIRYFGNTTPSAAELLWNSYLGLNSRIMVAGGGGGSTYSGTGGSGGGLKSIAGSATDVEVSTQTSGYQFGVGKPGPDTFNAGSGGGGGGYYGGLSGTASGKIGEGGSSYISNHNGCVAILNSTLQDNPRTKRLGTSDALCDNDTTDQLCSVHYSGQVFSNTLMIDGQGYTWTTERAATAGTNLMPNPLGGNYASGVGHTGNGYVRITYMGS